MKLPAVLGGIRGKLIAIFVLIKVVPLVLIAWFAWHATSRLGESISTKAAAESTEKASKDGEGKAAPEKKSDKH